MSTLNATVNLVTGLLTGTGTAIGGAAADTANWRTAVAPADVRNLIAPDMYPVKFHVMATGGETIKLQGTRNGTVWEDVTPITVSTGRAASLTLATGEYQVTFGPWEAFRFVKSAGVAIGTVAWAAANIK